MTVAPIQVYAGSWRTPTLAVSPYGVGTTVSVTITEPDGTTSTPTLTGTSGTWAGAAYQLDSQGRWMERWTVTGTGAGTTEYLLNVLPVSTTAPTGSYAAVADLVGVMSSIPDGVELALVRASRAVDDALLCAIYDTTDPTIQAALTAATVEQVAAAIAAGDAAGLGATGPASFSIGSLSVQHANGATPGPAKVGALYLQAWLVLQAAGLTGGGPGDAW